MSFIKTTLKGAKSYSELEEHHHQENARHQGTPRIPTRDIFANPMMSMAPRGSLAPEDAQPHTPSPSQRPKEIGIFSSFAPISLGPAHPADFSSSSPALRPRPAKPDSTANPHQSGFSAGQERSPSILSSAPRAMTSAQQFFVPDVAFTQSNGDLSSLDDEEEEEEEEDHGEHFPDPRSLHNSPKAGTGSSAPNLTSFDATSDSRSILGILKNSSSENLRKMGVSAAKKPPAVDHQPPISDTMPLKTPPPSAASNRTTTEGEVSIDMSEMASGRNQQHQPTTETEHHQQHRHHKGVAKSITLDGIASLGARLWSDSTNRQKPTAAGGGEVDEPPRRSLDDGDVTTAKPRAFPNIKMPRRKLWAEKHIRKRAKEIEHTLHAEERQILPFILDLGVALQNFGAPAHRSEYRLYSVAKRFALNGHFVALPTALFCSISQCGSHPYYETSHVRRVPGIDFNMQRLCIVDNIADQVANGKIDPEEGALKIEEALLLPLIYSTFLRILSFAISSAGIVLFFGKGYYDMCASFITGLVVGAINYWAGKYTSISRLNEVLGAFFAYLFGWCMCFIYPMNPFVLALAGVCWHLPGLSLTIAMEELATGNRVSGTARVTGAFITLFLLGLGMGGGNIITALLPGPQTFLLRPDLKIADFGDSLTTLLAALPAPETPLWVFILATVICSLAFGVLFNIRLRDMRIVIFSGLVGFLGYIVGAKMLPADVGNFLGAFCVSICSNLYARRERIPTTVGCICGILLLVPGSVGQRGVDSFMRGDAINGMNFVFRMLMISVQIVAGLFVGNACVDPERAM